MWKVCREQRLSLFPNKESIWDLNQHQLAWLIINVELDEREEDLRLRSLFDEKSGKLLIDLRRGEGEI
jgi:hypothetical protein